MMNEFPRQLAAYAEEIAAYARDEGLDFYETLFELLDSDKMNQVAAYGGFPQRYPHWRFGMEYEKIRKQHGYGLGKIYEMVINSDPCYAYLIEDNAPVDHKLVMAHVYAHSDFFKNNIWFSQTNRKMIDQMANHATRIRRHIERQGYQEVEKFIDTCLSLENLIDPHRVFIRRPPDRPPDKRKTDDKQKDDEQVVRYPAKPYMDGFINPPEALQTDRDRAKKQRELAEEKFPKSPVRDVPLFLLHNAALDDWQADVLAIIRDEACYYVPQGQTKIMNEGWATYWHSTLMTRHILRDEELITYSEHHAGTLGTSPGQLNPYKLGVDLFRDIEYRWNTGRYGKEYDECEDMERRGHWGKEKPEHLHAVGKESPGREKIFQVRKIYNDVTFIDEFLTPEFVKRHKLYEYRRDPGTGRMVAIHRDFEKIKRQLLFGLTNHAQPYIYVVDGNYRNRGELFLAHKHTGADLDIRYATETLKNIHKIWKRPVHLQAQIDDEMTLFSFENDEATQQKIEDDLPEPAHTV